MAFASFQVRRVKAFGEPVVDRGEQLPRLFALPLALPQQGQAGGGAQFPGFGSLLLRRRDGLLKIGFRVLGVLRPASGQRAFDPIQPGLTLPLLRRVHSRQRVGLGLQALSA